MLLSEADSLQETVRLAWIDILSLDEFDPALTWRDAGGDSLDSLNLMVSLEKTLGRKLSLDMMAPDMKPADLAEVLRTGIRPGPDTLPLVFLVPGMLGDEPALAHFRRKLRSKARFEIIEAPGLEDKAVVLCDLKRTGAIVAQRIAQRRPTGPLLIAGYSFGADVAHEAAQHLVREGREVPFVAILDAFFVSEANRDFYLPKPRGFSVVLAPMKVWFSDFDLGRRLAIAVTARLFPKYVFKLKTRLLALTRGRALDVYRPSRQVSPTMLVVSEELAPVSTQIWKAAAPGTPILFVPGEHKHIFQDPALPLITKAFAEALRMAVTRPSVAAE